MKLTRRALATAVLAPAALAQTTAAPEDELKAARDRIKAYGETLAKVEIPMSTEPAFQFKA
jgi:hypothetical protein